MQFDRIFRFSSLSADFLQNRPGYGILLSEEISPFGAAAQKGETI